MPFFAMTSSRVLVFWLGHLLSFHHGWKCVMVAMDVSEWFPEMVLSIWKREIIFQILWVTLACKAIMELIDSPRCRVCLNDLKCHAMIITRGRVIIPEWLWLRWALWLNSEQELQLAEPVTLAKLLFNEGDPRELSSYSNGSVLSQGNGMSRAEQLRIPELTEREYR